VTCLFLPQVATSPKPQPLQPILSPRQIGMVEACIRDGQLTKAIEYVERSKARNLVELLSTRNLYPKGVSQEVRDELDGRRQAIRAEQIRIDLAEWNPKVHETFCMLVRSV